MRLRPEPPTGMYAIEFGASTRRVVCERCLGGKTELGSEATCRLCGGQELPQLKPFERELIVPIGRPKQCPFYVEIDGTAYVGFATLTEANDAAKLWCGYVDGSGFYVTEQAGVHWPAVDGRVVRVVDNRS